MRQVAIFWVHNLLSTRSVRTQVEDYRGIFGPRAEVFYAGGDNCVSMGYYTQGGVNDEYFRENAKAVVEKMEGLEEVDFDIVAIDDQERCKDLFEEFHIEDREAFLNNCRNALTSISYRAEDQEIIVIKADKPFLLESPDALRGLLAHELMHIVHRNSGIEQEIQDTAKLFADGAVNRLEEMGLSNDDIRGFINSVFATMIFALKDIYANSDLIEQSFTEDLEAYYYHMLGIEDYCRVPEFYGEEASYDEVLDAIAFELGLLPAWLPFKMLEREESEKMMRRIQECYEHEIPSVANHIHTVLDVYTEEYGDQEQFNEAFFDQVLESSFAIIEEKRKSPEPM